MIEIHPAGLVCPLQAALTQMLVGNDALHRKEVASCADATSRRPPGRLNCPLVRPMGARHSPMDESCLVMADFCDLGTRQPFYSEHVRGVALMAVFGNRNHGRLDWIASVDYLKLHFNARNMSSVLSHPMPSLVHTFGILGFVSPPICSSVTTGHPSTFAKAMTHGSAIERFLVESMSLG